MANPRKTFKKAKCCKNCKHFGSANTGLPFHVCREVEHICTHPEVHSKHPIYINICAYVCDEYVKGRIDNV